jgi:hypothetical protein
MRRKRSALAGLLGLIAGIVGTGPAAADVNIGINIGTPPPPPPRIVIAEPPPLLVVPRTMVYYAPQLPYDFFYYDGRYYTYHEGGWWWSGSVHGPWGHISIGHVPRPVLAVPIVYYKTVPAKWRKHKRGGPPPWAPAHGYRRKHGHGHHGHHGHHDD